MGETILTPQSRIPGSRLRKGDVFMPSGTGRIYRIVEFAQCPTQPSDCMSILVNELLFDGSEGMRVGQWDGAANITVPRNYDVTLFRVTKVESMAFIAIDPQ